MGICSKQLRDVALCIHAAVVDFGSMVSNLRLGLLGTRAAGGLGTSTHRKRRREEANTEVMADKDFNVSLIQSPPYKLCIYCTQFT